MSAFFFSNNYLGSFAFWQVNRWSNHRWWWMIAEISFNDGPARLPTGKKRRLEPSMFFCVTLLSLMKCIIFLGPYDLWRVLLLCWSVIFYFVCSELRVLLSKDVLVIFAMNFMSSSPTGTTAVARNNLDMKLNLFTQWIK